MGHTLFLCLKKSFMYLAFFFTNIISGILGAECSFHSLFSYELLVMNGIKAVRQLIFFFFHRTYRHVAYYNLVGCIWRKTEKKNKNIFPACVVAAIRKKFHPRSLLASNMLYKIWMSVR